MESKREQIIDLINEFIYTNGRQRITAAQLNNILNVIANSFELVGEGTGGGINDVLNNDPNVDDNQKILNANGGQFELSGMIPVSDELRLPYIGFLTSIEGNSSPSFRASVAPFSADPEPEEKPSIGGVVSNQFATVIGNIDGFNPFDQLNEDNLLSKFKNESEEDFATKGLRAYEPRRTATLSLYLPDSVRIGDYGLPRGVYSGLVQDNIQNITEIREDKIGISAHYSYSDGIKDVERTGAIDVRHEFILNKMSDENGVSRIIQESTRKYYEFDGEESLQINNTGLRFNYGKRLSYVSGSETAGVASLVSGEVTVGTSALTANSYIMLTVQDRGDFNGNIRVASKSDSGFTIASSDSSDNCNVLWQIIDFK